MHQSLPPLLFAHFHGTFWILFMLLLSLLQAGRLISSQLGASTGGEVAGRILYATAMALETHQVVDTTGAGDAFIGAILYGKCDHQQKEKGV
jgi:hypothetical protein